MKPLLFRHKAKGKRSSFRRNVTAGTHAWPASDVDVEQDWGVARIKRALRM